MKYLKRILLVVLVLLVVSSGVTAAMVFHDPYSGRTWQMENGATGKLTAAATSGGTAELTWAELNGVLDEKKGDFSQNGLKISRLAVEPAQDGTALLYVQGIKNGMQFGLRANVVLQEGSGNVAYRLRLLQAALGSMPVAPVFALSQLQQSLPPTVWVNGDALCISKEALSLSFLGGAVQVKVKRIALTKTGATVTFEPMETPGGGLGNLIRGFLGNRS